MHEEFAILAEDDELLKNAHNEKEERSTIAEDETFWRGLSRFGGLDIDGKFVVTFFFGSLPASLWRSITDLSRQFAKFFPQWGTD